MRRRVSILFDNFGPYHLARLGAVADCVDLQAIEVTRHSTDYAWEPSQAGCGFRTECLVDGVVERAFPSIIRSRLFEVLNRFRPEVVVTPGWSSAASLGALHWCSAYGVPVVMMSESQARDARRAPLKEWIKRRLLGLCAAGLAGGSAHLAYLVQLGMPHDRVSLGYDAVDNQYFAREVEKVRGEWSMFRGRHCLPERYFLASARFVEKKNLVRLLEAYALYRELANQNWGSADQKAGVWDLVILGDGPLRATLSSLLSTLGLHDHVHLPGFKQYSDLPAYYALASAFIHASTTEPWGLVVNEAMASGLPVLVSNSCGCAPDLVQEGLNGFTFDPYSIEELARLMLKISTFNFALAAFGYASRRIIANWGPDRFASGFKAAVDTALAVGPRRAGRFDHLLLRSLIGRGLWK